MTSRLSASIPIVFLLTAWTADKSLCEDAPLMNIVSDDSRILVKRGDKVIFAYNKVPTEEAAKHEPFYTRSGYIHPVYSPTGKEVTGDYAEDHKHQHGLFFAWTKTSFEGRKPEFWNQKLEAGSVSYARTLKSVSGRERCQFVVEHLWEDRTAPEGPKPVLKETWKVTAYDAGEDRFVFDIESSQWLIGQNPLTIEKYHYGGMAIRGNDQWLALKEKEEAPPGSMLSSEGLDRLKGNHSRPNWVAMYGPVDDGKAGIAVLSDPRNFRAPQWVRLHPTKPYFVWAPMVEEPFQVTAGVPYISRYRYVVFDGEVNVKEIEGEWSRYERSTSNTQP